MTSMLWSKTGNSSKIDEVSLGGKESSNAGKGSSTSGEGSTWKSRVGAIRSAVLIVKDFAIGEGWSPIDLLELR